MQGDLFSKNAHQHRVSMPGAQVYLIERFIDHNRASLLLQHCQRELAWHQDRIKMFGKSVDIPRLQAWHGDPSALYRYSGLDLVPQPWTERLQEIKGRCQVQTGSQFNSVLANWYRDGRDSMGFHADNEPELGPEPVIATVTLGQERTLLFKHRNGIDKQQLRLPHGSLLVMQGQTQRNWQHGINKTQRPVSDRISLTFRRIVTETKG